MQLSDHFSLEELTHSETARRYKIGNEPTDQEVKNLQILAQQVLEPARAIVGKPLVISSGYRSKRLNQIVGGAKNSYHLQGKAADIIINTEDEHEKLTLTRDLADALNKQPLTDIVLCEYSKTSMWVHVQWSTIPRHKINYHYKADK